VDFDTLSQLWMELLSQLELRLLGVVLIVLLLWLLRSVLLALFIRRIEDLQLQHHRRKQLSYLLAGLGLIAIAWLWIEDLQSMATFLGLLSAGLAIALREPLNNFTGWLFIVLRHPFKEGDRIQIGDYIGDVIDIRVFQTVLLEITNWVDADQSTGRVLHVPNSWVFEYTLANYHEGFPYLWNELALHLTFESDWEHARALVQEIALHEVGAVATAAEAALRKAQSHYLILYKKLMPYVYVRIEQNGVLLTLRYLCEPRRRRSTEHDLAQAILLAFAQEPTVEFAYPTWRFYNRPFERARDISMMGD